MDITRHFGAVVAVILLTAFESSLNAQAHPQPLTPTQVDEIVDHLRSAAQDYVFPDMATKLQAEIDEHRAEYRTISDPTQLATRLTADMRAVGHDFHLAVSYGEELGVRKEPTPEEKQHAHAFDLASGYGLRSARRLPGNIGYIDLAYFSPDPDAGTAVAAAMQIVNGTDALIFDLRRNGGGSGETEMTLISYFFEGQLSSVEERVQGRTQERQHWTVPYVQGPRYTGKPVYILTSRHTHSAAEVLAYDLKNAHVATIVGEPSSGDATSASGEIDLGHGFSTFIANGQIMSPITHANYIRTGVQPDVTMEPINALETAYVLALKAAKTSVDSADLRKEKESAINDPRAALRQELDGFLQK